MRGLILSPAMPVARFFPAAVLAVLLIRMPVLAAQVAPAPAGSVRSAQSQGSLMVSVAVLQPDLTMRPVPFYALELLSTADSQWRQVVRTGTDGTARQLLPTGRYRVRSVQCAAAGLPGLDLSVG